MTDVSPKLNSPDLPKDRTPENLSETLNAASALKNAVEALASAIARGSAIQRAEARDRFDIALTDFSQLIDQTAE